MWTTWNLNLLNLKIVNYEVNLLTCNLTIKPGKEKYLLNIFQRLEFIKNFYIRRSEVRFLKNLYSTKICDLKYIKKICNVRD